MIEDPIVNEAREIRQQIASEHGYDVYQLGRYFMDKQKKEGREIISIPSKLSSKSKRISSTAY